MNLKNIFKKILFGGHLQALGAASILVFGSLALNQPVSFYLTAGFYLIFYAIYFFDRLFDKNKSSKKKAFWILASSAIAGFLLLFLYIHSFVFLGIIFLALGWLYPLFFKNLTRKIPLFKNIFVSLFFASLIFLVGPLSVVLALLVFFKGVLMQIALDLKDIAADKKAGLKTLGGLIGKDRTLIFLNASSVALACLFILFWNSLSFLSLIVIFDLWSFSLIKKEKVLGYLLQAGQFINWAIIIFLVKIIE